MAKAKNPSEIDTSKRLLSTREVAGLLDINEKMVYSLISDKGLPATKITGKWLFPRHLVEQWIETNTINYPEPAGTLPPYHGLLILAGSNDLLLDKVLALYNRRYSGHLAVFGNVGSMGGLVALRQDLCHIAASHLLQDNEQEYNFDYAGKELDRMPAVVNFCRREQGLILAKGNPKKIEGISDLKGEGIRIINRPLGTGTRLLLDRELEKHGLKGSAIPGYNKEVNRHLDVAIEILSGRADAGPGILSAAAVLGLDFIPMRKERYDLLIKKERFFDQGVQSFLGLLHDPEFIEIAASVQGYDIGMSGDMVFPGE